MYPKLISNWHIPSIQVKELKSIWGLGQISINLFSGLNFLVGSWNNTPSFKDRVEGLIAGISNDEEKIKAITDFVRKHMAWNGVSRRTSTDDLRKIFQTQEGSSADINLILVNMFRKAGLISDPVLLSTRDNGMVREQFALSSQFNYAIAAVQLPDRVMLIDATEKNLPINLLPERCINGNGWRVSKTKPGWVDLAKESNNSTEIRAEFEMGEDGALTGITDMQYNGYAAYDVRESHKDKGNEYETYIAESNDWSIKKSELKQMDQLDQPVVAHYEMKTTNGLEQLGKLIYFNPFVTGKIEENPFKLDERAYPVDFVTPNKSTYSITFKIPNGYSVEGLPESTEIELPNNGGKYIYDIKQIDGVINVKSELDISRAIFSGTEYRNLKNFYSMMVEKQAEQIVLKKTN